MGHARDVVRDGHILRSYAYRLSLSPYFFKNCVRNAYHLRTVSIPPFFPDQTRGLNIAPPAGMEWFHDIFVVSILV